MVLDVAPARVSPQEPRYPILSRGLALLIRVLDDDLATGTQEQGRRVDGTAHDGETIRAPVESTGRVVLAYLGVANDRTVRDVGRIHRDHSHLAAQGLDGTAGTRALPGVGLDHGDTTPAGCKFLGMSLDIGSSPPRRRRVQLYRRHRARTYLQGDGEGDRT